MALTVEEVQAILTLKDELSDKLQAINKNLSSTEGSFGRLGMLAQSAIGVVTVGSFIGAIKQVGNYAGAIDDMSKRTGIGAETIQRLSFAAEQNGASIEAVIQSLDFMSRKLVGGTDSTVSALDALKLNMDAVRSLSMDKAFIIIAQALEQVNDPMQRAALRTELLGRASGQLQSMMKDLPMTMAQTVAMTDEMVKKGDELGDAFDSLLTIGKVLLASVLVPLGPVLKGVADAAQEAASAISSIVSTDAFKKMLGPMAIFDETVKKSTDSVTKLAMEKMALTSAMTAGQGALKAATMSTSEIKAAEDQLTESVKKHIKEVEALDALMAKLSGKEAAKSAQDYVTAVENLGGVSKLSAAAMAEVNAELLKAIELGGPVTQVMVDMEVATRKLLVNTSSLSKSFLYLGPAISDTRKESEAYTLMIEAQEAATAAFIEANEAYLKSLGDGFAIIGAVEKAHKAAGAAAVVSTSAATQGYALMTNQIELSADAIRAWINLQKFTSAANAVLAESPFSTSPTQLQRISQIPTPGGAGGGMGTINITINGSVLGNKDEIARVVGDAIFDRYRSQGGRTSFGV